MIKSLFVTNRFFWATGLLIVLCALGFALPILFVAAQILLVVLLVLVFLDLFTLYNKWMGFSAKRVLPRVLSLGDANPISIFLENRSSQPLVVTMVDELPEQFQIRDFRRHFPVGLWDEMEVKYELRPLSRGVYRFGDINLFVSSRIGLLERRLRLPAAEEVPVYPSIIQMKQYEMWAFDRITNQQGLKKMRRIGHSYEFEQIKNYVPGDDYRSVNWKASSRRAQIMVNQYEDERSQHIYSIIDKSRSMLMPFNGLSLMDYAINTTLALSNIVLLKYDRAGLITFSDKIGSTIKADSRTTQLNKIMTALYREQERSLEANYELLYFAARKLITGRSLVMLYTNFESVYALERALPILRKINTFHLLVVVFFENAEIRDSLNEKAHTIEDVYCQTVARKFLSEKSQMVHTLRQYGIQAILTRPEDLTMNALNKYIELKARGLI